ncbi:hypothetical protein DSL64_06920 [Dyadobacter luteus]|jgi:hypothetical protein|uniref:Uncharacterized protein n=1 Tax=Dyadobacter luteus TaxID=2259619 RepID=A0A3D8YDR7_9BACT|nr:hypothetical protein DSL64_06920 [Dyadobacter luteus]
MVVQVIYNRGIVPNPVYAGLVPQDTMPTPFQLHIYVDFYYKTGSANLLFTEPLFSLFLFK